MPGGAARADVVDPLGRHAHGEPFEHGAGLEDLDRLLVRDGPHAGAAMRLADDEALLLEADQRRAHGAARHRELRAHVGLDQACVRRDRAAHDRLAERVIARGRGHRPEHTAASLRRSSTILFYFQPDVGVGAAAVLGLGEAGSRLAADLAAAGVDVRGYDPDPARGGTAESRRGRGRRRRPRPQRERRERRPRGGRSRTRRARRGERLRRPQHRRAELEAGARRGSSESASPTSRCSAPCPTAASRRRRSRRGPARSGSPTCSRRSGCPSRSSPSGPGDAATMKLLRSVFMKGLAASAVESLAAAREAEHEPWLEEQLAAVIGRPLLDRLVTGSRTHAARRVDEMEAARDLLVELDVEPRITNASAAVLAELAESSWQRAGDRVGNDGDRGGGGSPTERASTDARPGRVRPARARRAGRPEAPDRRHHAGAEVRRGRAGGLRPQVPLHVDGGARADRVRGRARRAGDRHADAEQRRRRHERRRRRDRGPRGRADHLDADRRLAGRDRWPHGA